MNNLPIIYHIIPNLVSGGAQTALRVLIENLPQYDHQIWFLQNRKDKQWQEFKVQNVSLTQLLRLIKANEKERVLFHFHWFPPLAFRIPVLIEKRFKSLVTILANHPCTIQGGDIYITLTEAGSNFVPRGNHMVIIPPCIDTVKWFNHSKKGDLGSLICHGCIYPETVALESIQDRMRYDSKHYSWSIIGDGDQDYIKQLQNYCINNPSIYIGPKDDICQELNQSWLYVHYAPKNFECFGLCFLEAMACGLPIITNDLVGGKFQIKDGYNGFVCQTYEEMKQKICYLYRNEEVYRNMVSNIAKIDFNLKKNAYIKTYEILYQELFNSEPIEQEMHC